MFLAPCPVRTPPLQLRLRHIPGASDDHHQGHDRRRVNRRRRHLDPARRGSPQVPRGETGRPVEPQSGACQTPRRRVRL